MLTYQPSLQELAKSYMFWRYSPSCNYPTQTLKSCKLHSLLTDLHVTTLKTASFNTVVACHLHMVSHASRTSCLRTTINHNILSPFLWIFFVFFLLCSIQILCPWVHLKSCLQPWYSFSSQKDMKKHLWSSKFHRR